MVIGYVLAAVFGGILTLMVGLAGGTALPVALAFYPVGGAAAALGVMLLTLLGNRDFSADLQDS